MASNPLPLVKDYHVQTANGTVHYHSAGAQFQDSLAHQDSIAVQLHDGISHHNTGSVQLHNSVSHQDIGAEQLHDSVRLVEILQVENAALKRELDTYYQRVCKLMRVSTKFSIFEHFSLISSPPLLHLLSLSSVGTGAGEGSRGAQTAGGVQPEKTNAGDCHEGKAGGGAN